MRYDAETLPIPLPEWEKLPLLARLLKIRKAHEKALKFLRGEERVREAEQRCPPDALTWEVLDADYYRMFPELHSRVKWFRAQWAILFSGFLKQIGRLQI